MPYKYYMSLKSAFTLIELLVVISIISLLVSILLPSLRSAMDLAKKTQCLSNVKQIMMCWHLYLNDNREIFYDQLLGWDGKTYYEAGEMIRLNWSNPYGVYQPALDSDYSQNKELFFCPSSKYWQTDKSSQFQSDYSMSTKLHGQKLSDIEANNIFPNPSETGVIADYHYPWIDGRACWFAIRHNQTANVGFLDGHSGTMTSDEICDSAEVFGFNDYSRWLGWGTPRISPTEEVFN